MKCTNLHTQLLITIIFSLLACTPQREASDLLRQAQILVDTKPGKALRLLDSISFSPNNLSQSEYMSYLVTRVQARYLNSFPVHEDIYIFTARDYFARNSKYLQQTALAFFYSGMVYREQGNFEEAMQHYKRAIEFAAKTNDTGVQVLIQFNIGDLLEKAGFHREALEEFRKIETLLVKSPNLTIEHQMKYLFAIGRQYSYLKQYRSAFAIFREGIRLAKYNEDNELLRLLYQYIAIGYFYEEEYENAEEYLRLSLKLNKDIANLSRYYLNFAKLFTKTNQSDSLNLYIDKLKRVMEQSYDLHFNMSAYNFLAMDAKARNNFNTAFNYLYKEKHLIESLARKRLESVYEVKRRYDYQRHQEAYMRTRLMLLRLTIVLLVVSLLVSLVVIFAYRRIVRQKNSLLSLQNVVEILKQTNIDLIHKQALKDGQNQALINKLNELQFWKFDTLFKLLLIKTQLDNDIKLTANTIVSRLSNATFGKDNLQSWDIVAKMVEEVYPDLLSFIKNSYSFSDTEYKVAVLSFVDVDTKDVVTILGKKYTSTIHSVHTSIRGKMNLINKKIDFRTILKQEYYSSKTH